MTKYLCDEHNVKLVRNESKYTWDCPIGNAYLYDEDIHKLLSLRPDIPEIRMVSCKSTTQARIALEKSNGT